LSGITPRHADALERRTGVAPKETPIGGARPSWSQRGEVVDARLPPDLHRSPQRVGYADKPVDDQRIRSAADDQGSAIRCLLRGYCGDDSCRDERDEGCHAHSRSMSR
jgi:hypothetical protein